MPRPTRVTIDPSALAANLQVLRAACAAATPDGAAPALVWAVVKADAYGHGLDAAVRGLAAADGLALVEFDRAARLRALGWRGPLLMLEGPFDAADVAQAAADGLALAVGCDTQLGLLLAHRGAPLPVHLKFNSGMNRLGFDAPAWVRAFGRLRAHAGVRDVVPMMHFARADEPGRARDVLPAFEQALAAVGLTLADAGFCNSAAVLDPPAGGRTAGREVRPGIAMYGASPFADRSAASLGLRAAMDFESALIAVRELQRGDEVGYGGMFRADGPMRIGVVACGYADGYPRHAPTGTPVAVDGVRTRTVGRVSMDMLTVDLQPVPAARVGSAVQLWGAQVAVDDVAAAAGTIGYELLCAIAPRVSRSLR